MTQHQAQQLTAGVPAGAGNRDRRSMLHDYAGHRMVMQIRG
jgi:hypothetical protein